MEEFVFNPSEWFTPNTYDRNFKNPPNAPGVYLIALLIIDFDQKKTNYDIQYVGSAKDLSVRYSKHEVLRMIRKNEFIVQFFFKEIEDYLPLEKKLIKSIQPKYNIQWR
jgi:excinuclease UvrABC nuclease subunit